MVMSRVRPRRRDVIVFVVLLTSAACTAEGSFAPEPSSTSLSGSPSTTTSPRCEVDDGTGADLEPLVTDKVPAGYERAPDAAEDTGPAGLARAAFFVGVPDELAVLHALRFRRGYQRLWYPPDGGGNDLIVHLYEFCDADGAAGYLRHTRDRLLSPLWGSVETDVPGLPEAGVALLQEADSGGESFVAVLQVVGRFYVEIGAYGGQPGETLDTLLQRAASLSDAQVEGLS